MLKEKYLIILGGGVPLLVALPIVAAVLAAFAGDLDTLLRIQSTVLPTYARNTLILMVSVGALAGVTGTATAWLVTVYKFPASRLLAILLVLPLAFPAYVLAYAYTALLDHPGPVQTLLRNVTGFGPREYWFPEIRSIGGAIAMLTCVLYPYVYLLARASFRQQATTTYLVARTLGQTPFGAFWRVALPMSRPAIAGGILLVVMETIADYGTVAHFNVQTFATGIYQAWFSIGDRAAAAQLSLCLLTLALLLAALERKQRGRVRLAASGGHFDAMELTDLTGIRGWLATLVCLLPVLVGFLIPLIMLTAMAVGSGQSPFESRYVDFFFNSVILSTIAAAMTLAGAILVAFRARLRRDVRSERLLVLSSIGYAVPGGVIAIGLMVPFARFDNWLDDVMGDAFGIDTGLLITGSIWLLIVAYMVRFMAAALNAYDSGLSTVPLHFDAVARSLGQTTPNVMRRIHLPAARTSVLTAGLVVFVDVMKELPATLILHPFNFQTLAVQAHRLASDERLAEAAVPSLVLVAVGVVPVVLLCRQIGKAKQ